MNAAENTGGDLHLKPTFIDLVIPKGVTESLGQQLADLGDPTRDMDRATARCHQIFATLPIDLLQTILDFGRHADTPGVARVGNLPVERELPDTPDDGGPCRTKRHIFRKGFFSGSVECWASPSDSPPRRTGS